jgi:hypothetical protein
MLKAEDKSVLHALDKTEGLKEVDAKKLQEFQKLMTEEVIPKIVEAVEERRVLAAQSREMQLKC